MSLQIKMGHGARGAETAPALQAVSTENANGNAESGSVNENLALLTPFQLGPFKLSHRLVVTTSTALINHLVSIPESSKLTSCVAKFTQIDHLTCSGYSAE